MTELFRIKPLEWDHRPNKSPAFIASPFPEIQYQVGWNGGGPSGFLCIRTSRGFIDGLRQSCTSPEEGKQLAEQHWREYVIQALEPHGSCLWKYDPDGYWKTGCGNAFVITNEESLIANGFHFCYACGKRIEERPLVPVGTEQ